MLGSQLWRGATEEGQLPSARLIGFEQSKHLKPFFQECRGVFWFESFPVPIKDQPTPAALCAYAILACEEVQNFGREQLTDLLFVFSSKQVLLRELSTRLVRLEIYVLGAKHGADFVEETLRTEGEQGEVQPWRAKKERLKEHASIVRLPRASGYPRSRPLYRTT